MIHNDEELAATRQRIDEFLQLLAQLRRTCRPEELPFVVGGYRAELERMQRELLDYLTCPANQPAVKAG